MMNELNWLALKNIPGIGNLLFKRLIDRFETLDAMLGATQSELIKTQGISIRLALAILNLKPDDEEKAELNAVLSAGCRILTYEQPEYPDLLKQIPDPPPFFTIAGSLVAGSQVKDALSIAIVGSRSATSYGLSTAESIAGTLAGHGVTIVSGLARGIDTSAHIGTIKRKGRTIAVLGSGLGHIYPSENKELAFEIAKNGAVISEFDFMAKPEPHHFPKRNRIISGISHGTVIVEAALKSGSLITARLAAEQNREVFAIPGNIHSDKSSGAHALINSGAKLICNAQDILEEFTYFFSMNTDTLKEVQSENKTSGSDKNLKKNNLELDFDEMSVLKELDLYPVHIDEIIRKTTMDAGKLSAILLKLELLGIVNQTPGKYFSLNEEEL